MLFPAFFAILLIIDAPFGNAVGGGVAGGNVEEQERADMVKSLKLLYRFDMILRDLIDDFCSPKEAGSGMKWKTLCLPMNSFHKAIISLEKGTMRRSPFKKLVIKLNQKKWNQLKKKFPKFFAKIRGILKDMNTTTLTDNRTADDEQSKVPQMDGNMSEKKNNGNSNGYRNYFAKGNSNGNGDFEELKFHVHHFKYSLFSSAEKLKDQKLLYFLISISWGILDYIV